MECTRTTCLSGRDTTSTRKHKGRLKSRQLSGRHTVWLPQGPLESEIYIRFNLAIPYLEIYTKEETGQICKDVCLSMIITINNNNNKLIVGKTINNLNVHS